MRHRFVRLYVLASALSVHTFAQTSFNAALAASPKPEKDESAVAALSRTSAAAGWSPALRVGLVKVTGTMSRHNPATGEAVSVNMVFKISRTDKMRIETGDQGSATIVTPRGLYVKTKTRELYLPIHAAESIKPIFLPFMLRDLDASSPEVEFKTAGGDKVGSQPVHKISMRNTRVGEDYVARAVRRASPMTVWLADDSDLPVQIDYVLIAVNNENSVNPVTRKFSDYRAVNGVMVAFHQEEWIGGELSYSLDLKDVIFNAPVEPSEFDVPKPAATSPKGGRQ